MNAAAADTTMPWANCTVKMAQQLNTRIVTRSGGKMANGIVKMALQLNTLTVAAKSGGFMMLGIALVALL